MKQARLVWPLSASLSRFAIAMYYALRATNGMKNFVLLGLRQMGDGSL